MSCPTCGHTMACLAYDGGVSHYHCPRCGTVIRNVMGDDEEPIVPKLVERCREFAASTVYNSYLAPERLPLHMKEEWELGPGEAIYKPEDRPT